MELMKKMIKTECGMDGPFAQPHTYPYMRGYVPPVVPPHFYPPEIDVGGKFYHPPAGQRFPTPPMCKVEKDDSFHGFMQPFGGERRLQGLLKPVYDMEKMPQQDLALPSPKVFTGQFDMGGSNGDPLSTFKSKSVSDSDKRDKQEDNNGKGFAGCPSSEFRKRDKADTGSPYVNSGSDMGAAAGGDFCGAHHQPQLSGDESNGDDAFTTL